MFDIEYKGGNGLVITTKKTTIVIDPKLSVVGLKDKNAKEAIEIATEARFAVNDDTALISIEGPGDYEISDLSIHGVSATRHIDTESAEKLATLYRIEVGEVRVAIIGNIAPKLSDDQLEEVGVVDIVVIPVGGGGYTLDATSAAALIRQIDPKVIIPVHYADDGLSYEVPQDSIDTFVKEISAPVEKMAKYRVKGASSLPQSLTIVQLERS